MLPDVQTNILVPRSYRILTLPPYSEIELHLVEVFRMTLFRVVFGDDASLKLEPDSTGQLEHSPKCKLPCYI